MNTVNKYFPLFSSLREPNLPDTILPDVPVTYTEVEQGTQRKGVKLVSSDSYEYTKMVSTVFFWQDNTLYAYIVSNKFQIKYTKNNMTGVLCKCIMIRPQHVEQDTIHIFKSTNCIFQPLWPHYLENSIEDHILLELKV